MNDHNWLAQRFEEKRGHLRAVAYRMLGSETEAEDAVQEAWLRLSRSDASVIQNLGGWLTSVVGRVCLDMLRSRKSRKEGPLDELSSIESADNRTDPERDAMMADSVGLALLVVLETLAPAERVAFVLHDMFDMSFDEIAPIVGRSPVAARQLASRARRRVQGGTAVRDADLTREREVVDAFVAASRSGNFNALLALLDPDVVVRADQAAVEMGATGEVRGANAVAKTFSGRAGAAKPALLDGAVGLAWAPGGQPRVIFHFAIVDGRIATIDMVADTRDLRQIDLTMLED
ncbi:MAG TPA: sigma-70 family RNA polymerase sigma factor [Edaphobacter sp.]|nr:sigma-70 family RNA polymerase sigma factor [Edaphobacter sp.]